MINHASDFDHTTVNSSENGIVAMDTTEVNTSRGEMHATQELQRATVTATDLKNETKVHESNVRELLVTGLGRDVAAAQVQVASTGLVDRACKKTRTSTHMRKQISWLPDIPCNARNTAVNGSSDIFNVGVW